MLCFCHMHGRVNYVCYIVCLAVNVAIIVIPYMIMSGSSSYTVFFLSCRHNSQYYYGKYAS